MDFQVISRFLQEKCQIDRYSPLIIGVSGGADSVCLLHLLYYNGFSVTAAHLDHMIRPTSGNDVEFISGLCDQWGVKLVVGTRNVPDYCKQNKLNLEEGAREQRYDFLFSVAKDLNAKAVLTAHHADDQVETVLMHFIRGAGLSGLKGMLPETFLPGYSSTIPILRPLLDTTRRQIDQYIKDNQIPFVDDETNQDTSYYRNRLRHELIPLLETYNPNFRDVLIRSTHSLQEDARTIDDLTSEKWKSVLIREDRDHILMDTDKLASLSRGTRWNIFRKAVHILRPDIRDFNYDTLIKLEGFYQGSIPGKMIDLVDHLEARMEQGKFVICDSNFSLPVIQHPQYDGQEVLITPPFEKILSNQWMMTGSYLKVNDEDPTLPLFSPEPNEGWLDQASVTGNLFLRNIRPGDRIQPLGNHRHHTKVSDVFINRKIPVEARSSFPLICDDTGIIWLPGIMISDRCKVSPVTKKILHLAVRRIQY